jgi:hypothetical protein
MTWAGDVGGVGVGCVVVANVGGKTAKGAGSCGLFKTRDPAIPKRTTPMKILKPTRTNLFSMIKVGLDNFSVEDHW